MCARARASVCDVGVLWVNASTDRVVFGVRVDRGQLYFVSDGSESDSRKGDVPEVGVGLEKFSVHGVHVRYMRSPARLSSVVCLSVTLMHPTQPVKIFGNVSTRHLAIR